ncbi:hypothetical protein [Endozoicomonas lisbonensis]|uniref:NlpC/P60 domain-containing protein n=1 Tax=Endozoicomonas lisbonensis TaxID=3120522 RepID=A0ABV2SLK4_9GAMM
MKLDELELGDILFYFNRKRSVLPASGDKPYAVTHVAIVSHVGTCPWVSHITERGLVFNAIKIRDFEYRGLKYLVYRLRFDQDLHFAAEASQLARMWCIANENVKLTEKKTSGNAASVDSFLPVVSVPHTFSYFKSHSAIFRSASFGKKAIDYVNKLEWYKVQNIIPPELRSKGGMYCSMFVVSCYQAVFGINQSADMLAVDARTVMPWTLYGYIDDKFSWKCLGEIDFVDKPLYL